MPSTLSSLLEVAGLPHGGTVAWGQPVPERSAGVYLVALTSELESTHGSTSACSVSDAALRDWLKARPELRLDGQRPDTGALAVRLASFWLPDEVTLYIGLARTSLRDRVSQYYRTPLGARRLHAGGYFIKTLRSLTDVYVHFAPGTDPATSEGAMLAAFCERVSRTTLAALDDPEHPFPFANLEWPPGVRKRHGIRGATGDTPGGPS